MSQHQSYPPPGAPPPGVPEGAGAPELPWASYAAPVRAELGTGPERGMLGAVHKPGAMPLRPLGLGDTYDAALRIIRFNPRATVGAAIVVAAVAALVPVTATAVLTWTAGLTFDPDTGTTSDAGRVLSYATTALLPFLSTVGLLLVTGLVAHVAAAAAVGRRLTVGDAWAATRGKRWRLVGLTALITLGVVALLTGYVLAWIAVSDGASVATVAIWGVITVPLFLLLLSAYWIRLCYLSVPALMLEPVGVLGAIRRGYRLGHRQFWRVLGISLLTVVISQVAGLLLGLPSRIAGEVAVTQLSEDRTLVVLVVTQALGTVAATAFTAPFSSAVASLQYLDQRMRKEAYDVDLMTQAGVLA